jgi:hypothetical protein
MRATATRLAPVAHKVKKGLGVAARFAGKHLDPRNPYRSWKANRAAGIYFATDLTTHPTMGAALDRSIKPVSVWANVKGALLSKAHPARIAGALIAPLTIKIPQQLANGGLDARGLAQALNPTVLGFTFAGGILGEVSGAAVQSLLAKTGTTGAFAGLVVKPLISFGGYLAGMNLGENWQSGGSFRGAAARALRDIQPYRDAGQIFGYAMGSTFGQVAIQVKVLGGIVPGMIMGTLGAALGTKAANSAFFGGVDRSVRGWLNALADRIDPLPANAAAAPAQARPVMPDAESLTPRQHPSPLPPRATTMRAPAPRRGWTSRPPTGEPLDDLPNTATN